MQIDRHSVVSFDYTLTDSAGQELDSSKQAGPLTYLHGVGGIIPGLEAAMGGRAKGDRFTVTIPPDKAYGEKDPKMVVALPRERFNGAPDIQVGMQFRAQMAGGDGRVVTVVAADDKHVTIDGNHPLAGQSLTFDINVVDVRAATPEEIDHGHIHGQHCEHHDKGGCGREHGEGCGHGGCE